MKKNKTKTGFGRKVNRDNKKKILIQKEKLEEQEAQRCEQTKKAKSQITGQHEIDTSEYTRIRREK